MIGTEKRYRYALSLCHAQLFTHNLLQYDAVQNGNH